MHAYDVCIVVRILSYVMWLCNKKNVECLSMGGKYFRAVFQLVLFCFTRLKIRYCWTTPCAKKRRLPCRRRWSAMRTRRRRYSTRSIWKSSWSRRWNRHPFITHAHSLARIFILTYILYRRKIRPSSTRSTSARKRKFGKQGTMLWKPEKMLGQTLCHTKHAYIHTYIHHMPV